jgi:hypothetical protein
MGARKYVNDVTIRVALRQHPGKRMNEKLETLISSLCSTISFDHRGKMAICAHYDRIFSAIKEAGYTEFVAHQWTVDALAKVYGPNKVTKAIGPAGA